MASFVLPCSLCTLPRLYRASAKSGLNFGAAPGLNGRVKLFSAPKATPRLLCAFGERGLETKSPPITGDRVVEFALVAEVASPRLL